MGFRPPAAVTSLKFPSLWVFKAERETESLLMWAKVLRMCRSSVNITGFSLFKGKKGKTEELFWKRWTDLTNIWIFLPCLVFFEIYIYIYTYFRTNIRNSCLHGVFILLEKSRCFLLDLFLYYYGSFHPRISNFHAEVFMDSKTRLNKFEEEGMPRAVKHKSMISNSGSLWGTDSWKSLPEKSQNVFLFLPSFLTPNRQDSDYMPSSHA